MVCEVPAIYLRKNDIILILDSHTVSYEHSDLMFIQICSLGTQVYMLMSY